MPVHSRVHARGLFASLAVCAAFALGLGGHGGTVIAVDATPRRPGLFAPDPHAASRLVAAPVSVTTTLGAGLPSAPAGTAALLGSVAFTSDRSGGDAIFVQDVVDSGSAVPFVDSPGNDAMPAWSPDGRDLAFRSDRDGNGEIYLRTEDGVDHRLTDSAGDDTDPSWAPDGRRILFSSGRGGASLALYSMNRDGSDVRSVLAVEGQNLRDGSWSPDGARLVYAQGGIANIECLWNWDVWTADAGGGNATRLTESLLGNVYPTWTPDGYVAYSECRGILNPQFDLFVEDASSGDRIQVTGIDGNETQPMYAPDASGIGFVYDGSGDAEVWVAPTGPGQTARNLTNHSAKDTEGSWRLARAPNAGECHDAATFARQSADPTVEAASPFAVSFEVVNSGACAWTAGDYHLAFVGGDAMGAGGSQRLPASVAPGAGVRFDLQLTAPTVPGSYRTEWSLAHGARTFGPRMSIEVTVTPRKYTIAGRVTEANGDPMAGVTVAVGPAMRATTGVDGRYSVRVPEGDYEVSAARAPYAFAPVLTHVHVPPDAADRNFARVVIDKVEVNQAIGRQWDGEQHFVAGKDTAIRVWLTGVIAADAASQEVVARFDGSKRADLELVEPDGQQGQVLTFLCDWSACDHWRAGRYTFEASVAGSTMSQAATFEDRNTIAVLAVPVTIMDDGKKRSPDPMWRAANLFTRAAYPIAGDGLEWYPNRTELDASDITAWTSPPGCHHPFVPGEVSGTCELWQRLWGMRPLICGVAWYPPCYDQVLGFIPDVTIASSEGGRLGGWTYGLDTSVVLTSDVVGAAVAHEIGHNFDLGDEYRCGRFYCDRNAPPASYLGRNGRAWFGDPPCDHQCGNSTATAGPTPGTGSRIDRDRDHPLSLPGVRGGSPFLADGDLMSFMGGRYRDRQAWITPRIYSLLFDELRRRPIGPALMQDDGLVAIVTGWVGSDGTVVWDPVFTVRGGAPEVVQGAYRIEVVDAADVVLASQGFDVSFLPDSDPTLVIDPAPFRAVVAFPPGAARLRIVHGATTLAEMTASPNPPTARFVAPVAGSELAGRTTVRWESADPDGGTLSHVLNYSHDGQAWIALPCNPTARELDVDVDGLPGSDAARFRLTVSDGINTTEVTSPDFRVGVKGPVVAIESPKEGDVFPEGHTVALVATVDDPQSEESLGDASIVWTSDRDGLLGIGEILYRDDLTPGPHAITLAATSPAGRTTVAVVHIHVGGMGWLPAARR